MEGGRVCGVRPPSSRMKVPVVKRHFLNFIKDFVKRYRRDKNRKVL